MKGPPRVLGLTIVLLLVIVVVMLSLSPQVASASFEAPNGGFLYPFSGTANLTQNENGGSSGSHSYPALDFTVGAPGTNFNILAPKDGIVLKANDSAPDTWTGNCAAIQAGTNYIVLGHGYIGNGSYNFYTLYYHLKNDSIPNNLTEGTFVKAGTVIGQAGKTGWSTGNHLHIVGSEKPVVVEDSAVHNCSGQLLDDARTWAYISPENAKPIGFVENSNMWPIGGTSTWTGQLTANNNTSYQTNYCDPRYSAVILYEHIDYSGKCISVPPNVDYRVPSNFGVSSIYLNRAMVQQNKYLLASNNWFSVFALDAQKISQSESDLRYFAGSNWNDQFHTIRFNFDTGFLFLSGIGGGWAEDKPSWLNVLSMAASPPFHIVFDVDVDLAGDLSAWRFCIDTACQEQSPANSTFHYNWSSYGWADGFHTVSVQYRRTSDNGNWATAWKHEEQIYLSPDRAGIVPCDVGDGVSLESGSDCITLTQTRSNLYEFGWSDKTDLEICAIGNYEAWAYDSTIFEGKAHVILSGECKSVGNNVSSVELRTPRGPTPPTPTTSTEVDQYTYALYRFDEGTGTTTEDSDGNQDGTVQTNVAWVDGKFGKALDFNNTSSGSAASFPSMDICPVTFEAWVNLDNSSQSTRLAGQVASGGNERWLVKYSGSLPEFEIWDTTQSRTLTSSQHVTVGEWHYLMVTYNCSTHLAEMYINNVLVASQTMNLGSWATGSVPFEVGAVQSSYHFNGKVDEVRLSNVARRPVDLNLDVFVSNPATNEVTAVVDWKGATNTWQMIDWDDGNDHGIQSAATTQVVTKQYPAGTYDVSLTVTGADGLTYTVSDQVVVQSFECGSAVTLTGVVAYDYRYCATMGNSDKAQFLQSGLYNLSDYGLDNSITSMHIPAGMSVRFYEGPDGTGQTTCRWPEDMWDMSGDTWPNSSAMDNSVSSIQVFSNENCTPPPTYTVTSNWVNPLGHIEYTITWSGAAADWHMLYWGDGNDYGFWGSSGSVTIGKWYSPGNYTVTFDFKGADGDTYSYVIPNNIPDYECGSAVTLPGVTLFEFQECASTQSSHYEQYTTTGTYNLSGLDNKVTSLHIQSGWSVRIYKDANQSGQSMCVTSDKWNMETDTWSDSSAMDNTISSIQVFNNSSCTP